MYVCLCNSVRDKDIKRAVKDGAMSMSCLQESLSVSTCCGQCYPVAKACLESHLEAELDSEFLPGTA